MGDERRRALRVPVRGVVVFHADGDTLHGTIENVSASGALVSLSGDHDGAPPDVELKLGHGSGRATARTVRIERDLRRTHIAIAFEEVEPELRASIEAAVENALRAAARRPVLVVDDSSARRHDLVTRLVARGMTPLAPRTPLEAIDLLARSHLHINVCLLAAGFGHSADQLRALVAESFPWVTAADISDDVEATVERAADAWSASAMARLATAIA
ncbi:MAG TPA: PilZ domain-containing protein [Kofleriaceae bacterium]